MTTKTIQEAIAAAEEGRLDVQTAVHLYERADLLTLGQIARDMRMRKNPEPAVTYAVDRNINYTNICVSRCAFCAFCRQKGEEDAYVLDEPALERKCRETLDLGGTHILYQGGLNPDLDLAWHENRIRMMRRLGLHIHGFSPPEILFMAEEAGLAMEEVIQGLIDGRIRLHSGRRRRNPGGSGSRAGFLPARLPSSSGLRSCGPPTIWVSRPPPP